MFHGDRDQDHAIAPTVMISKSAVQFLDEHASAEITASFQQGDVKSSEWEKIVEVLYTHKCSHYNIQSKAVPDLTLILSVFLFLFHTDTRAWMVA